jgi:ribosomal protein S18 acetylase RimI-like enzyme
VNPPQAEGDTAAAIAPLLAACYGAILQGAASPDVVTTEGPHFVAGRTPVPLGDFNRIMVRTVTADPSEAEIDALLAELDGVPEVSCWLPPGGGQQALESRFASRGFRGGDGPGVPAMWTETADLAASPLPPGVTIERVVTPEASDLMTRVAVDGFGAPRLYEPPMADLFRPIATRPVSPVRLFLARLDGRAVATALGAVSGETVGIYNVATLPEARGRGIGGAVTLAAILDARDRGVRLAVLESSGMGLPVYQRLGFTVAARYRVLTRHIGA